MAGVGVVLLETVVVVGIVGLIVILLVLMELDCRMLMLMLVLEPLCAETTSPLSGGSKALQQKERQLFAWALTPATTRGKKLTNARYA